MPYPDYGTPGSPNLDPYYMTPAQQREAEEYEAALAAEHRTNIRDVIAETLSDTNDLDVGWYQFADAVLEALEKRGLDVAALLEDAA